MLRVASNCAPQVMEALKAVYPEASIQARLLENAPITLSDISSATLAVIRSRHYFADHDDLQVTSNLGDL